MNTRRILVLMVLVSSISCVSQPLCSIAQTRLDGQTPQSAVSIATQEALAHSAVKQLLIHCDVPELTLVALKLVVTPSGTVSSATPSAGGSPCSDKATVLAMSWQFVPFERQGTAIYATFSYSIDIVPSEQRPRLHKPFPKIRDWSSLRIAVERGQCMGLCPWYKLTVLGDGTIVYNGYDYVGYCGEYRAHVSREAVHQIVYLFKRADYFNLFDRYDARASDVATFVTSIAFDNNDKSVLDELGLYAGMPEIVRSVEDGIDRLAGPKVWATQIETHSECWASAETSDLPSRIE